MKKIVLLFIVFIVGLTYGQTLTGDNTYSTTWQDSLYTGHTSSIIPLGINYSDVYVVGKNNSATADSVKFESGTIDYSPGLSKFSKGIAKDTNWTIIAVDSLGTLHNSNEINFPTSSTEYYLKNSSLQVLRITLSNVVSSKLYYWIKAIKHKSY